MSDLLSQKANVYGSVQTWDADGGEHYGDEAELYLNEPCLLVPMSAQQSALHGLDFASRPYLALFNPTRYITRASTGQAYQDVRVAVVDSTHTTISYMVVGPQVRFGEGFDIDDVDHLEVPVVRRDSA